MDQELTDGSRVLARLAPVADRICLEGSPATRVGSSADG